MNKQLRALSAVLLMLALCTGQAEASSSGNDLQSESPHVTIKHQQHMNNPILAIALLTVLVFSVQAVVGQEEIYRPTQEQLDNIAEVKSEVEAGIITKSNWTTVARYKRETITEALDPEVQKRTIEDQGYNATGKKAMAAAYAGLLKSLAKHGISVEEPMDIVLKSIHEDIVKTNVSVNNYKAGDLFMVSGSEKDWLLRAISKKEYQKWFTDSQLNWANYAPINKKKFDEAFAELNASAAKKIPAFKPNAKNFATRNTSEVTLMKKQLDDPAKIKIHQIGLAQANWDIQKNELDVPQKRYKAGYIWGKDSRDDFPYCRLYQVNIIQEYEGGGKYGASYAVLLDSWIVACP